MPVNLEFLRGVLGLLCVFFAHMSGRATAAPKPGRKMASRPTAWYLRTVLCGGAMLFRHALDGMAIGVFVLAAAAFGAGWYLETHAKQPEDLTHEIFPE